MIENLRERFEIVIKDLFQRWQRYGPVNLERRKDRGFEGDYGVDLVQYMWELWQVANGIDVNELGMSAPEETI